MSDFSKLPKYAQDYIATISRERDAAVLALKKFCDEQTKSSIWVEEHPCTGEEAGPSFKRRYVQGHKLTVQHAGVELRILLARRDDGQRDYGIELGWGGIDHRLLTGAVAMLPKSMNQIQLVAKENLR